MTSNNPSGLAIKRLCDEKGMSKYVYSLLTNIYLNIYFRGRAAIEVAKTKRRVVVRPTNEKVDRRLMPFVPQIIYLPLTADKKVPMSCLNKDAHYRYVSIISNFLKPEQKLRFDQNKLELRVC